MNDLKHVTQIVKAVLEKYPQTRNSDSFLYLKVLHIIGRNRRIDINGMTVGEFLLCKRELGLPGFETVRRTRQKIQAANPELAACESVNIMRLENENEFRRFAKRVLS